MKTAGQTDLATWHVPQCVFVIEYSRALLAEIEWNVLEAFDGGRGGGVETAGVLFGIHLEGVLRITGFRPIECEHRYGPAFILSDTDRANLGGLLEKSSREPALDGVAVGWYHSHTRSGVFLSGADLELHRRFFPETWQVALVLRPSLNMATRAGFFIQETDGAIRTQDCYREFELAGVESAVTRSHAMRSAGMEGRGADAGGPQEPNGPIYPAKAASAAAPLAPAEAGPTGKSKMRHWPWLAAGLLLGIAGASWYHSATVRPLVPTRAAPLRLRVMDQSGLLRIEWDRNKLAATELLGGSLEIQDGKNKTNLPLDRAAIQMGSFEVLRHSQVVRVTLKIRVLGAGPIEEVTEFSGPTPTAEVPPDEPGDK
jgi:proteasome lid subunit RPN8/RPN11